jgi:tRNA dimethylallyltransferase
VDKMFECGLLTETEQLLQHGLAQNKTAMQAIGYRQVVEHLHGERNLSETVELVKSRTRQFAKRQLTWFRRHAHSHCIELQDRETAEETAGRILANTKT